MRPRSRYVFDTFAVIALLESEPGESRVKDLLTSAASGASLIAMSLINWGEVLYSTERKLGAHALVRAISIIDSLPIELVSVDRALAQAAAHLKIRGRLSYADCYAAALAQTRDAAVVTGDPEFHSVENLVAIEWLPQRQA